MGRLYFAPLLNLTRCAMSKREFRFGVVPEVRDDSGSPKIVGYASVFNEEADLGYFREVIKPGAFKRSIAEGADVRALVEHDPAMIIGRSKAGSLTLKEDDKGLLAEIEPPDTQVGRDVVTNLRNGNLDKMSFGFYIKGENMRKIDGQWLREITDVDLFDVSVVTFPAYEGTSVQARSLFPDGSPELPNEEPEKQEAVTTEELDRMKMRADLAERE
jgi:HK97 family phage prohead protease